ncbi:MAG: 50S ribosomal protein L15 [Candidatus Jorgensenbacteria bacterium]
MQFHNLSSTVRRKKQKRIGRGGKRGTYSGRGQKGQRARSGHRIRPASRDLIQRIPKLRGVKHRRLTERASVINVGELSLARANEITMAVLRAEGFIRKSEVEVKILGGGEVKRALTVKGINVSASAKKKIEAAGGKIIS